MASYLSAASKHVIIFHLLTEGRGHARIESEARPLSLIAGDLVIFPHGDAHVMGNGPPVKPVDSSTHLQQVLAEGRMLAIRGRRRDDKVDLRVPDVRAAPEPGVPLRDCLR